MSLFRRSAQEDLPSILSIIRQAQQYLASQGVDQWQDGYPNESVIREDMRLQNSYVLEQMGAVVGIATIVFDGEPSYAAIYEGRWMTPEPYACIHRIAMEGGARGSGMADQLMEGAEKVISARGIRSVRIDTHADNMPMQRMLMRNGYRKCGVIYLQGGQEHGAPRIALEKALER